MDAKSSFLYSREPSTGTCPEADESSPHPTQPVSLRSILISPFHAGLGLPSGLLPSDFPIKTLYVLLFSHTCASCLAHLLEWLTKLGMNRNLQVLEIHSWQGIAE